MIKKENYDSEREVLHSDVAADEGADPLIARERDDLRQVALVVEVGRVVGAAVGAVLHELLQVIRQVVLVGVVEGLRLEPELHHIDELRIVASDSGVD